MDRQLVTIQAWFSTEDSQEISRMGGEVALNVYYASDGHRYDAGMTPLSVESVNVNTYTRQSSFVDARGREIGS